MTNATNMGKVISRIYMNGGLDSNHGCSDRATFEVYDDEEAIAVCVDVTNCHSCWQVGHDEHHVYYAIGERVSKNLLFSYSDFAEMEHLYQNWTDNDIVEAYADACEDYDNDGSENEPLRNEYLGRFSKEKMEKRMERMERIKSLKEDGYDDDYLSSLDDSTLESLYLQQDNSVLWHGQDL